MIRRSAISFRRPALAALCLALAAYMFTGPSFAKNLGVRGQIWAIAEPDLLTQIEARLVTLNESGELNRLE